MMIQSSHRFLARRRVALIVGGGVAAVVLAVVAYRMTAPTSAQRTSVSGDRIPESDVLQVGALPVT